ncbi:MAG: hypothetical protein A2Z02_01630 [Chloroflexi bacterium RBG_16_48_7]|nr:MAG: hypothetical protein A2Z02_01630 [Chloroflexi bacterium RBG_16_48_7]
MLVPARITKISPPEIERIVIGVGGDVFLGIDVVVGGCVGVVVGTSATVPVGGVVTAGVVWTTNGVGVGT